MIKQGLKMPKRIPDEELTPEQLAKREKRRRYLAANRERIKAQRHDYYLRNVEKIKQLAREQMAAMTPAERGAKDVKYRQKNRDDIRERRRKYYAENAEACKARSRRYYARLSPEQKKANAKAKRASAQAWVDRNVEKVRATRHRYYLGNRAKKLEYAVKYHEEHADELCVKSANAQRKKTDARKMCPAFMFTEYLRLKEKARFVAVYLPHTNLAHKAAKTCVAIQQADYSLCPICRTPRMHNATMKSVCPMPHVFEFDDAVQQIRKFAKQIVAEKQK